jgi:hypothetical protein
MLGRDPDGVVRHFEPDLSARCTSVAYDPNIDHLNKVIKTNWKPNQIEFCGFVHSHPGGYARLSGADHWYAGEILACFKKLPYLWLPIVLSRPDAGRFQFLPFVAFPDTTDRKKISASSANFEVIAENDQLSKSVWQYYGSSPKLWAASKLNSPRLNSKSQGLSPDELRGQFESAKVRDQRLTRMLPHYQLDQFDNTRLVVIGTGGAASFIRNCARMGYGEFVLIDPDTINISNLATQQVEPEHIGRRKIEVLADDIRRLNPAAAVLTIADRIENLDDACVELLIVEALRAVIDSKVMPAADVTPPRRRTILLVLTDSFEAQARGHRLGLHFGLPTICAQEYREGRGAEVTYTVGGVTSACHRCITSSRYSAYLTGGYKNDVTSSGAPIFAAEMLNSVIGHILLAITHHGTRHPRWGDVIQRLGNRNLIRLRMDPDFDAVFGNTFARRIAGAKEPSAFVMLDTLFLSQTPDRGQNPKRPVCPDCGGVGDLRKVQGQFNDTRHISAHAEKSIRLERSR